MPILYEPKGRAREYAPLAVNHYNGCTHGCQYCYVPTIPPYKFAAEARAAFHACGNPRARVVEQLRAEVKRTPGRGQRVLLSFTTDPYQEADATHRVTRAVIETLHGGGYAVQVLTKGGRRSLVDRDLFSTSDAYAATMTFLDPQRSLEWEPGAALPADRIAALDEFHAAGVPTWVSLEPVLDPASALQIIRETHSFVDLFKIGRLNHHPLAERINWRQFGLDAVGLCESLGVAYYIKDDLRATFSDVALGPHHRTAAQIESAPPAAPVQNSLF